ncbi:MAG: hypothetical protein HY811_00375 [Planctomycetes bacterium]|nr:hypothetical protein [Planctomycetota bacterium]
MKINIIAILKDRFIMGFAVWGIALAVVFIVVIRNGRWVKIEELRDDIKRQEKTLDTIIKTGTNNPTKEKIEACIKYKKTLEEEIQKCNDFYTESDKTFEEWFHNVELTPAGTPTEGAFLAAFRNAKREIILNQLTERNIKIFDDHGNEISEDEKKFSVLNLEDPTHPSQFRRVQKQFWIVKKLTEASVAAEISKCGQIKIQPAVPPLKIPEDLGVMIPFEIKVYMPLKNAAKLINNICDTSRGGPFIYITHVKITRSTQQGDEMSERNNEPDVNRGHVTLQQETPEVKITISGNVLDFGEKIEKPQ